MLEVETGLRLNTPPMTAMALKYATKQLVSYQHFYACNSPLGFNKMEDPSNGPASKLATLPTYTLSMVYEGHMICNPLLRSLLVPVPPFYYFLEFFSFFSNFSTFYWCLCPQKVWQQDRLIDQHGFAAGKNGGKLNFQTYFLPFQDPHPHQEDDSGPQEEAREQPAPHHSQPGHPRHDIRQQQGRPGKIPAYWSGEGGPVVPRATCPGTNYSSRQKG